MITKRLLTTDWHPIRLPFYQCGVSDHVSSELPVYGFGGKRFPFVDGSFSHRILGFYTDLGGKYSITGVVRGPSRAWFSGTIAEKGACS